MDETDPIADWMRRWGSGDPRAAELLFARYGARLTQVAEQHLSRKLAAREGGEDVVQSVFRTFFRRSAEGQFQIDGSAQVWRLLVKITVQKVRMRARYHTAKKRSVAAEVQPEDDSWVAEALAREPDPAAVASLVDLMEALVQGVPPLYCRVLELRLQGMVPADVARELNISRNTVYRALGLFKQRLIECGGENSR
jgi:DNA-directed RNA polymerase specialized sigma24 family protein